MRNQFISVSGSDSFLQFGEKVAVEIDHALYCFHGEGFTGASLLRSEAVKFGL
jgi:hypothetical protein